MNFKTFGISIAIIFLVEILGIVFFMSKEDDPLQDAAEVNEAVQSVTKDWENMAAHENITALDYTVLDSSERLVYKTRDDLSESINAAVIHRDTILDITRDGSPCGKIIIYSSHETLGDSRKKIALLIIFASLFQCSSLVIYLLFLSRRIMKPFKKLESFAERVATGNLDIPLEMDRENIFGAFTESFDIMRTELKRARLAEARANAEKRELVAKLSHDIRTPVASIKAASEVGEAMAAAAQNEKVRENYTHIIRKADQINTLVTNLFSAALKDLGQLSAKASDVSSSEVCGMLTGADYLKLSEIPHIPDCVVYADKLRLQQVFDNIFANSYKYANTKIQTRAAIENNFLNIRIEDMGGGVDSEELPLLKEKYHRGKNAANAEGAGLGLYICDSLMKEMKGELEVENGSAGLAVTVKILLSGTI